MNIWQNLPDEQRDKVRLRFEARSLADELNNHLSENERGEKKVSIGDLYKFVKGRISIDSSLLSEQLSGNSLLNKYFDELLQRETMYFLPRVAAASSGLIDERVGEGFSLKIRPSISAPSQVYVVLELYHSQPHQPTKLVVKADNNNFHSVDLQEFDGNTYQFVLEAEIGLVPALRDAGSEVYLI